MAVPLSRPGTPVGGVYYGWILAVTLGVTETVSWGILFYAFGVFLQPMEAEFGWSRAQLSGAFTVALLVSGAAAIPAGRWIDRHGARALMTAGSCAAVVLVLAWARVEDLGVFYLVMAGTGVAMAATLYDPAFAVLATWFRRHRARAFMVLTLMAGLASTIFMPLAAWLVERQGWRAALVTLAAILAVTTVPAHALLLRRRPEDMGLYPDGIAPAVDRRPEPSATPAHDAAAFEVAASVRGLSAFGPFRWLSAAFCLYAVVSAAVGVHLVPYLVERGSAPTVAAAIAGLVGAAQLLGRIAFARVENWLPRRWLTAVILLAQPLALVALLAGSGTVALFVFVFLFGASRGAATLSRATLVAAQYGPGRFGSVNGVLSLLVTFTGALAPFALGAAHDLLGAYEPALWLLAAVGILAALAAFPADPPSFEDRR